MGGHRDVEARRPKPAEDGVVMAQVRRPGIRRASISPTAHGWRVSASRTAIARLRIDDFQSPPPAGTPTSLKTTSTIHR